MNDSIERVEPAGQSQMVGLIEQLRWLALKFLPLPHLLNPFFRLRYNHRISGQSCRLL
jgi:hypothetical protein